MSGNVLEWCLNTYENPEKQESVNLDVSGQRVFRGGAWGTHPENMRSSFRFRSYTRDRNNGIGFRLAQDIR